MPCGPRDLHRAILCPLVERGQVIGIRATTRQCRTLVLTWRDVKNDARLQRWLADPSVRKTTYFTRRLSEALWLNCQTPLRGVYNPVVTCASWASDPRLESAYEDPGRLDDFCRLLGVPEESKDRARFAAKIVWDTAHAAGVLERALLDCEVSSLLGRVAGVPFDGRDLDLRLLSNLNALLQSGVAPAPGRPYPTREQIRQAATNGVLPAERAEQLQVRISELTMLQQIADLGVPHEGRLVVQPHWSVIGTATGRVVSSHPNVQGLLRELNHTLRAHDGFVLVSGDWRAQEAHIFTWLSEDPAFARSLRAGDDPYLHLAKQARLDRATAKRALLALAYGAGRSGIQNAGVPLEQIEAFTTSVRALHPSLANARQWPHLTSTAIENSKERELLAQIYGKNAPTWQVASPWSRRLASSERAIAHQTGNSATQGAGAHMLKLALISIDRDLPEARIVLPRHDEIIVEAPTDLAEQVAEALRVAMWSAGERMLGDLAPQVEVGAGETLASAKAPLVLEHAHELNSVHPLPIVCV